MFIRFLKKMVMVLAVLSAVQGCALYVGEDDGFYYHHHSHHGYWEHRHSSLPQQMAENRTSTQTGNLDGGGKLQSKPLAESGSM